MTWAVLVMVRRPTTWQTESTVLYGPLSQAEMEVLARVIPQHNVHHVTAYQLREVPTELAALAATSLRDADGHT
jgi:hypothetical protein